ncbi:MAG TPA: ATP-binding protein [Solirubrobacteraceae bacterium]|nr:ATP-binding protein [Solirubrobacteraceae bacterium]
MRRLSIARVLTGTLVGIVLILAVVTALGIAALYQVRQDYENQLSVTSSLQVAAANLESSTVFEELEFRKPPGTRDALALTRAQDEDAKAASTAQRLVGGDPDGASARLLADERKAEGAARDLAAGTRAGSAERRTQGLIALHLARARTAAADLSARQEVRAATARGTARSKTRRALIAVIVSGGLALLAVILLIVALIRSMRAPLAELVSATRRLADGDLSSRVRPAGPRELQSLGEAFNRMGEDLAGATAQIEAERRRLSITIESLGDALIICETDGTVVAVNPRAGELVPDVRLGARVGRGTTRLPELARALAGEVIVETDRATLAVTASRLTSGGGGVIWTVRDVSERARLERAKTEFVATASHELRSPLTSIKGYVELLGTSKGLTPRQSEFVRIILLSADRLVDLVNDLLDVAKLEANNVELDRRPTDVSEILEEVAELMAPRLENKHQQLDLDVGGRLPQAYVDPGRTRQIVTNLLTNAHIYTADGGRLGMRLRAGPSGLEIAVSDTGRGMTPEERERVFERFYRGDGPRAETGTGLGLSIVKSLVDLHGGSVDLQSEVGVGTTFTVRLPLGPGNGRRPPPAAMAGRRVLVVDDEPALTRLIAEKLAPLGVEAVLVNSGREALARLRSEQFDVVTLDVLMPGINGIDTLRAMRADPRLKNVPAVFISAFPETDGLASEWVVPKPVDGDELCGVVASAVAAGRTRVLVVAREEVRDLLRDSLDGLGVESAWEASGPGAARACELERFEVALIDAGLRNPQAVVESIELRGRRGAHAVIFFAAGDAPAVQIGVPVLPVAQAALAVRAALSGIGEA